MRKGNKIGFHGIIFSCSPIHTYHHIYNNIIPNIIRIRYLNQNNIYIVICISNEARQNNKRPKVGQRRKEPKDADQTKQSWVAQIHIFQPGLNGWSRTRTGPLRLSCATRSKPIPSLEKNNLGV